MSDKVVVRFAPSPTGPLHIGGVRTALFNYLFAKKHQGTFILRIEDTDQTRFVEGAEAYINDALKWLGMSFDAGVQEGGEHGPYRQSERAKEGLYRQYAEQLLKAGHAYIAFDTPEELDAMRERLKEAGSQVQQYNYVTRNTMTNSLTLSAEEVEKRIANGDPYVIRMKMPRKEEIRFHDIVRDWVVFHSAQLDDKILLKSDGMPTYHLANVVDDHLMEVTHVIRGEEWLSSTPLHVMLYRTLGWEDTMPKFVHLPLILNPNGKGKMSKRQGDKLGFSVFPTTWQDPETGNESIGYREEGYLADGLMNFLALLGWNPGNDEELMDEARLIELFDLERIGNSGTKFDLDKLKWFNQTYIRQKSVEELAPLVRAELAKVGKDAVSEELLAGLITLLQERVTLLPDFATMAPYLFDAPTEFDEKTTRKKWKGEVPALISELADKFEGLAEWNSTTAHDEFQAFLQAKEVGLGKVMAPLRLALTGLGSGPGIFDIADLMGQAETVERMRKALEVLPSAE
ncbi:glutamate--tRNA ligase [Pontibacter sp. G13]|uniref:glutamate--tRNA ligase n=1 Tax=Pontibacter sp. G13 TaxID=3074898 RepID=UPI00288BFB0F|nr:glutamate--tRNA ligase [Pontibacter sp. G13]WNJ17279.1 glutamate--tRNA ligase [Pontibacter sp. G13]